MYHLQYERIIKVLEFPTGVQVMFPLSLFRRGVPPATFNRLEKIGILKCIKNAPTQNLHEGDTIFLLTKLFHLGGFYKAGCTAVSYLIAKYSIVTTVCIAFSIVLTKC